MLELNIVMIPIKIDLLPLHVSGTTYRIISHAYHTKKKNIIISCCAAVVRHILTSRIVKIPKNTVNNWFVGINIYIFSYLNFDRKRHSDRALPAHENDAAYDSPSYLRSILNYLIGNFCGRGRVACQTRQYYLYTQSVRRATCVTYNAHKTSGYVCICFARDKCKVDDSKFDWVRSQCWLCLCSHMCKHNMICIYICVISRNYDLAFSVNLSGSLESD